MTAEQEKNLKSFIADSENIQSVKAIAKYYSTTTAIIDLYRTGSATPETLKDLRFESRAFYIARSTDGLLSDIDQKHHNDIMHAVHWIRSCFLYGFPLTTEQWANVPETLDTITKIK